MVKSVTVWLQNALPVMVDLQLRALEQPGSRSRRTPKVPGIGDDTGAHFSREYMNQVVQEVHQALRAAGLDSAARQAQGLICNTRGAQSIPSGASADRSSSSVDILACEFWFNCVWHHTVCFVCTV